MRLRIDHVAVAVRDLGTAASRFYSEFGLDSVQGGRHGAWGTANRIVPLGREYVELVGVVAPSTAARSAFGRAVLEASRDGDRLLFWAVGTDDIDDAARRLTLEVTRGARTRRDGSTLAWRNAGVQRATEITSFPFFIQWDGAPEMHPGRDAVAHRVTPRGIAWVEVAGDEPSLRTWLGENDIPLRIRAGEPGLEAVGIATTEGEIILT